MKAIKVRCFHCNNEITVLPGNALKIWDYVYMVTCSNLSGGCGKIDYYNVANQVDPAEAVSKFTLASQMDKVR